MSRLVEDTPHLFVTVDETGTPGKREKWKTHYIMAGCLVNDENAFAMVTKKRWRGKELKFHDDRNLRVPIIKEATDYVDCVYYVEYCKSPRWHLDESNTEEVKNLHRSLLQSLIRGIANANPGSEIEIVIDHTVLISDKEAENIASAESGATVGIDPHVEDSKEHFGLMTNDFFVGAIGYRINTPYDPKNSKDRFVYSKLFEEKTERVPYREFKDVVKSNNVGNPSCRDPATARATQTSYGVRTNSPTRGLVGRTNASKSSHRYKIPGQEKITGRKGETSPTETPCPLAGLRVLPLRRQRTDACSEKRDTGIRSQNLGRGPAKTDNVGNPGRHYPAAAGATQTSYGVQTNSPTRGLIGRTNGSKSSHRYKIPGQKGIRRLMRTGTQKRTGLFGRRKATGKEIRSVKR